MSKNWETHKMSLKQWGQTPTRPKMFLATSWWACVTTCSFLVADFRGPWHWACVDAHCDEMGLLSALLFLERVGEEGEQTGLRA